MGHAEQVPGQLTLWGGIAKQEGRAEGWAEAFGMIAKLFPNKGPALMAIAEVGPDYHGPFPIPPGYRACRECGLPIPISRKRRAHEDCTAPF